jgi:hypothetical protein
MPRRSLTRPDRAPAFAGKTLLEITFYLLEITFSTVD